MLGGILSDLVVADDALFLTYFLVGTPIVAAVGLAAILLFVRLDLPPSTSHGVPAEQPGPG